MAVLGSVFFLALTWVSVSAHDDRPLLSPGEFAAKASSQMLRHQSDFIQWFYGGAIVLDGLFRVDDAFPLSHRDVIDGYLDQYVTNTSGLGYKILHNVTVAWYHNVGDLLGLFPVNYLSRALTDTGRRPGYKNNTDLTIVDDVIEKYIKKFPLRLPDGTFVRNYGWSEEPNGTNTFLWADDMYMGLTLVARRARSLRCRGLATFVADQVRTFARFLQDPEDGLYHHGANVATGHWSCCKWGRANGWALLSQVEVLVAMETVDEAWWQRGEYWELVAGLRRQAEGLRRAQNTTDGRWHQVVNESSTFLETSGSAMFVSGLARSLLHGWLDPVTFLPVLTDAWRGLNRVITDDGTIRGVCNGLGIGDDLSDYQRCDTSYLGSSNGGLGAVLYAAADYHAVLHKLTAPAARTDVRERANIE